MTFILSNLPFYLLHSLISFLVCFVLLLYMDEHMPQPKWGTASAVPLLAGGVALGSLFYAAARVQYGYKLPFGSNGADFAVLMIVINVSAALMAFGCAALCKRQAETPPDGPQPTVRQDLRRTPLTRITTALAAAVPAPAAAAIHE